MTRKDFLRDMFEEIFDLKGIEYKETKDDTVVYYANVDLLKDCSYSQHYKKRVQKMINELLNEKCNNVCIKRNNRNGKSEPETAEKYQKNARKFLISLLSSEQLTIENEQFLKKNLTVTMMAEVYSDIIIKELFNIENRKIGKDRGNDNFDESKKRIAHLICEYLNKNADTIKDKIYKNSFFNDITKEYPVLAELDLDENSKIVFENIKLSKSIVDNLRNLYGKCLEGVDEFEFINTMRENNYRFSSYGDIENMTDEDFWLLECLLTTLCNDAESYNYYFKKEEFLKFKNTAVRLYNHFYGKNHSKYEDLVYIQAWQTHSFFMDYLFILDLVWKNYGISE